MTNRPESPDRFPIFSPALLVSFSPFLPPPPPSSLSLSSSLFFSLSHSFPFLILNSPARFVPSFCGEPIRSRLSQCRRTKSSCHAASKLFSSLPPPSHEVEVFPGLSAGVFRIVFTCGNSLSLSLSSFFLPLFVQSLSCARVRFHLPRAGAGSLWRVPLRGSDKTLRGHANRAKRAMVVRASPIRELCSSRSIPIPRERGSLARR